MCKESARIEAIAHRVAAAAGFQSLKQEQVQAVVEFVCGHDVFVSLPTGFGKSLHLWDSTCGNRASARTSTKDIDRSSY